MDLAYLYYPPFCSVFTWKDNFHAQIVPLFLGSMQDFVNGIEFKEDLKKLNALCSALPDEVLRTGLINFAAFPPEDTSFFVTRMWDKYLPSWRITKAQPSANATQQKRNACSKRSRSCRNRPTCSHTMNAVSTGSTTYSWSAGSIRKRGSGYGFRRNKSACIVCSSRITGGLQGQQLACDVCAPST